MLSTDATIVCIIRLVLFVFVNLGPRVLVPAFF
jgi:hypothetical protein